MDTDKRYTGPQPDEGVAAQYLMTTAPRFVRIFDDATMTNEQTAAFIEQHLLDVQKEYQQVRNPNGDYNPTAVVVIKEGKSVIEVRLNGWTVGTIS